jgi:alanine racemase
MHTKSLPRHRCWAEIDLAALERNIRSIQTQLPQEMEYIAVVKADAYGHGMPQIVRRMLQSGIQYLAVANVHEAADIRHMGLNCPILILSPLLPEEDPLLFDFQAIATISSQQEARRLQALADERQQSIEVHLKIDTGMGRLGVWHEEATSLIAEITQMPRLRLSGLYTHFACADTDQAFTQLQRQRLQNLLPNPLPQWTLHADNSSGIASTDPNGPWNAARIGLLQFGVDPQSAQGLPPVIPVEAVFSFHARIGLIKKLPANTPISYGSTHRLQKKSTIAILTAGYADGIPYLLSNRGHVIIANQICPIIGRITMDQTIVDISHIPKPTVGDPAILIGNSCDCSITLASVSQQANTIPWETLCSITKRVTRVYRNAREL